MVIRVLAGAVPMICGALIFSGVIPVGKWVMGSSAPNPAELMRTMQAADDFARVERGISRLDGPVTDDRLAAMTPEQRAAYRQRLNRARARQLDERNRDTGGSGSGSGWAPRGGGWGG